MAERLTKIIIPQSHADEVMSFLQRDDMTVWQEEKDGGQSVISVLSELEATEKITDALRQRFGHVDGFRMVVQKVEASISSETENQSPQEKAQTETPTEVLPLRISREELYAHIQDDTRLSRVYIIMTALSTVVAAIGFVRNNVAVIIGAMVIAPLLGPNVALALSATLGDLKLGLQAIKTFIIGTSVALVLSLFIGFFLHVNPELTEVALRTQVGIADIVLALAAGCAGVLAYTTGASGAVIGVMVAVALLPPLVVFGLLLGAGYFSLAFGALLLFLCNVICVNLTGVLTFILQGIQPRTWWETDRAKRATRIAILSWLSILIVLFVVVLLITK